jgi:hypothetical protein
MISTLRCWIYTLPYIQCNCSPVLSDISEGIPSVNDYISGSVDILPYISVSP